MRFLRRESQGRKVRREVAKLDMRRAAVAMAAHNPPAAKLAAEASFDAIWDPRKTQNTGPICPKTVGKSNCRQKRNYNCRWTSQLGIVSGNHLPPAKVSSLRSQSEVSTPGGSPNRKSGPRLAKRRFENRLLRVKCPPFKLRLYGVKVRSLRRA